MHIRNDKTKSSKMLMMLFSVKKGDRTTCDLSSKEDRQVLSSSSAEKLDVVNVSSDLEGKTRIDSVQSSDSAEKAKRLKLSHNELRPKCRYVEVKNSWQFFCH